MRFLSFPSVIVVLMMDCRRRFSVFSLLFLLSLLVLNACSLPVPQPPDRQSLTVHSPLKQQLYQQYSEWKGTKYQLGGVSKQGIDCSAFMQETFRSRLGIELPRTTILQSRRGQAVRRDQLLSGDLVFFKTGRRVRHVGVYLEEGRFLHASTSKGVTISRLDNPYWRDRFWQARRLISPAQ